MNYICLKDNKIANIIVSDSIVASRFDKQNVYDDLIPQPDLPVHIGDSYIDGKFYRDGIEVTIESDLII